MFRKIKMAAFLLLVFAGCKNSSNTGDQEKAINPSIIDNPSTASPNKNSKDNVPVFQFEHESHDFGKITAGEKISFAFSFKNVGKGDLVIRAAQGSCGCTVPEFPKDAVKPGDGGIINVTFNSEGREGHQDKTVTVISNTMPNTHVLTITGDVVKSGN